MRDAAKDAAILLYSPGRYFPGGYDQKRRQSILLRRGQELRRAYFESLSKSAEEPDHPGGLDVIQWPRRQEYEPFSQKDGLRKAVRLQFIVYLRFPSN